MASIGKITGVNGNLIRVKFESAVSQNEVAYAKLISKNEAGKTEIIPLKSEVIRIRGDYAELQVFEDTTGLKAGDEVEFTGELLSVEGTITRAYFFSAAEMGTVSRDARRLAELSPSGDRRVGLCIFHRLK